MLEEFVIDQPLFCSEIKEAVLKNRKVSHAYLIESHNYEKARELVLAFSKVLLNLDHEIHCSLENNPDFKWIEPDGGLWIKKEQLIDLQTSFKTKSFVNGRRVYVIYGADKLNKSSSNAMLKFLEEPFDQIVAILVTPNRYQVLPTIVSRCQVFSLEEKRHTLEKTMFVERVIDFSLLLESKGSKSIAFLSPFYQDLFATRESSLETMKVLCHLYTDFFEILVKNTRLGDLYPEELIKTITDQNIYDIINKLNVLSTYQEQLKYNVNLKMWLDSFILSFGGDKIDRSSGNFH